MHYFICIIVLICSTTLNVEGFGIDGFKSMVESGMKQVQSGMQQAGGVMQQAGGVMQQAFGMWQQQAESIMKQAMDGGGMFAKPIGDMMNTMKSAGAEGMKAMEEPFMDMLSKASALTGEGTQRLQQAAAQATETFKSMVDTATPEEMKKFFLQKFEEFQGLGA